jgi:hypothetical protein
MRLQSKRIRGFLKAVKPGVLGPLGLHLVPGVMAVVEGVIRACPSRASDVSLKGALSTHAREFVEPSGKKKPRDERGFSVNGSPTWARTRDPMINSHLLYQLSYRGSLEAWILRWVLGCVNHHHVN